MQVERDQNLKKRPKIEEIQKLENELARAKLQHQQIITEPPK